MITQEQVREIAEKAATEAANKAVTAILTTLGVDVRDMAKEQKVWAFARTMQQGTARGAMALVTGFFSAAATLFAGAIWYFFFKNTPPH